jgi:hypothetical protein
LEKQKTLDQHDGQSLEHTTYSRRSSENIGTSGPVLEDRTENAARTVLIQTQNISGTDTSTEELPISSLDPTTRSQETLDTDRNSELGSNQGGAGKPVPNLEGRHKADGILILDSPTHDNFWYSFLEPLPIDTDW